MPTPIMPPSDSDPSNLHQPGMYYVESVDGSGYSTITDRDVLTFDAASQRWVNKPAATVTGGGGASGTQPNRWAAAWKVVYGALNGTPNVLVEGDSVSTGPVGGGSSSDNGVTSLYPQIHQFFVNAGTAVNAVYGLIGTISFSTGKNLLMDFFGALSNGTNPTGTVTNTRWWMGFSDQSIATMGASATPTGKFAAFRFDSGVDGHYTALCSNGGGTVTAVNCGIVPVDLGTHGLRRFRIQFDDTNGKVLFYIDGLLKATITTNLPSSTGLVAIHTVTNLLATKTAQAVFAYQSMESDI